FTIFLFFFLILPPPPISTLFPYTTLFRSLVAAHPRDAVLADLADADLGVHEPVSLQQQQLRLPRFRGIARRGHAVGCAVPWHDRDRKSTRLNSSHSQISYAVFCLKKKKK